jgi:hypothetical protein
MDSNHHELEELRGPLRSPESISLLSNSDLTSPIVYPGPRESRNLMQTSVPSHDNNDSGPSNSCPNSPGSKHAAIVSENTSSNEKASLTPLRYTQNQKLWRNEIVCMAVSIWYYTKRHYWSTGLFRTALSHDPSELLARSAKMASSTSETPFESVPDFG